MLQDIQKKNGRMDLRGLLWSARIDYMAKRCRMSLLQRDSGWLVQGLQKK